jgi:copper homeostasis protein
MMKRNFILEICVDSVRSAINAQKGGADRVELCANMYEGGTSPSVGQVELTRKYIDIELYVMIRPRGGDFCYSDLEFEQMKREIIAYKELLVDGFVFGILKPDGTIDTARTKELVALARPKKVTFHRAFDMCADPLHAVDDLIALGVDRILSSGQRQRAMEGAELLQQLILRAKNRIIIMPGSGINSSNIIELQDKTGAREFHMTANSHMQGLMLYQKSDIAMGGKLEYTEYGINETSVEKVQLIVQKKLKK